MSLFIILQNQHKQSTEHTHLHTADTQWRHQDVKAATLAPCH